MYASMRHWQDCQDRMRANMKFIGHLFLRQLLSAKAGNFPTCTGKMTSDNCRQDLFVCSSQQQQARNGTSIISKDWRQEKCQYTVEKSSARSLHVNAN